jgi:hypothetical protein
VESTATAAAEEILRIIYGEDLRGCAVNVDRIAGVIQTALEERGRDTSDVAELHLKAFEAVQLLSTPPTDGHLLSAEDLRSLLGDRLDKIRTLATKILSATRPSASSTGENGSGATQPRI